jgi:S1-C subfamily serine protease
VSTEVSDSGSADKLSIPRKIVKAIALGAGAVGTLICLMALVGLVVESGWVRAPVAIIAAIAVPALISDRLLPDEGEKSPGLVSDVFALSWLGLAAVMAVAAHGGTKNMIAAEGDRLQAADMQLLASVAYFMAGVDAQPAPPTVAADASASSSASASAAKAATTAPSASASTEASAAPASSSSAAPAASSSAAPDGDDAKPKELTPAEIFKTWAPSVVTVSVKKGSAQGGGTGFLIDNKGTIATNHHVIVGAKEAVIRFKGGAQFKEVWVLMVDAPADLALLRVDLSQPSEGEAVDIEPVTLGDSEAITVGKRAISIGNPLGLEHTLTTGIVSARRNYRGRQWIQMSTPISPGNSGGPVFNGTGEVIGMTTATIGGGFGGIAQNLNLAIPINTLKDKIKTDYPEKRKFGKGTGPSHW